MVVRETSRVAHESIKDIIAHDEYEVLAVIKEIGPAHDKRILEALNQKEAFKPRRLRRKWEINAITGRRHSLVYRHCLVRDLGVFHIPGHPEQRPVHLWRAVGDNREPVGWVKIKEEPSTPAMPPEQAPGDRLRQIREERTRPIVDVLDETPKRIYEKVKGQKTTHATRQYRLFPN